ncbi:MAG: FliM/FliN family flagellar motor switch protein [Planctomycetaceae bacterium]|nr:FliM/FliN family flagellar motor switch protein [Planctomycetaceae bacterium]
MTNSDATSRSIFAEPRRLASEANRALEAWQKTVCSLLQENWRALLGSDLTVSLRKTDSSTAIRAVNQLQDPGYAARLQIGPRSFGSLFAFPSRLVQALVSDMLGTPCEEWPEVRDLTTVETSMVELLCGEITRAISQAWPEVEPLECELECVIARPMRSRLFPPDEVMVRTFVSFETHLGPEEGVWLMPQAGLTTIGISNSGDDGPTQAAPQIRVLAEQLPITMVVQLGGTRMSLADLNGLKTGDYLALDQGVNQPLEVTIDGRLHWLGHPCRLGTRQGFQIIASRKQSKAAKKT